MATPAYFQQYPDVAAMYERENYGLTPQQFADTHYQLYGSKDNEKRISPQVAEIAAAGAAGSGTTITPTYTPVAAAYFQKNPDVAQAYQKETYNLTPDEFAKAHYNQIGWKEQRTPPPGVAAITPPPAVTPPVVRPPAVTPPPVVTPPGLLAPPVVTPPGTTPPTNTGSALPYFQLNPDVAAAYANRFNNPDLASVANMTPEQFAAAHYAKFGQFEKRSVPSTSPFASATSGFGQNFQNYTSIPIGAQYNANVVGGTGSPYSQIMAQMRPNAPAFNPYMGVASNTPMGGYDPNLYNQIAQANAVAKLAAGTGVAPNLIGGDDGGAAAAAAAAAASAADSAAASAASATGTAPGSDGSPGSGAAMGGLITSVWGDNPPGPDDGAKYLDIGEYVIKKSSVNKYGKGLLDMINEGKVPAKKMKSLLG